MMNQRQATRDVAFPDELTSPRSKLVYFYLHVHGEATVSQLADSLDMGHMTLYSALRTLREYGIVSSDGERFRCATS